MTRHMLADFCLAVACVAAFVAFTAGVIWLRDRWSAGHPPRRDEPYQGYQGNSEPETVRLSADPDTGEFARIPDEWDAPSLASLHDDVPEFGQTVMLDGSTPLYPGEPRAGLSGPAPRDTPALDFTDEHMERLVLALTESPEAWRRRMEAESASWRTTVSTGLGLAVDFGDPLCLAVA